VTFPGIGLGAVLSRTRLMTSAMLVAAVQAVREISVKIARNVIKQAVNDDLAQQKDIPNNDEDLEEWIREQMWNAEYRPLELVEEHAADAHARGEAGVASGQRPAKFED
jgi:malate dehydrogenase (oxaloacetate-decarboxylating)